MYIPFVECCIIQTNNRAGAMLEPQHEALLALRLNCRALGSLKIQEGVQGKKHLRKLSQIRSTRGKGFSEKHSEW